MSSPFTISLRKAGFIDIEFLWYLRNQQDVYTYSRTSRPVLWEEHVSWILPILLGLQKRELFIIQDERIPVGQIRLDWREDKKEAEVSISLLKEFRGKGIASCALAMIVKEVSKGRKGIILIAEIRRDNVASIALFEKFHFLKHGESGDFLSYRLTREKQ